jgi:hypothetical protein
VCVRRTTSTGVVTPLCAYARVASGRASSPPLLTRNSQLSTGRPFGCGPAALRSSAVAGQWATAGAGSRRWTGRARAVFPNGCAVSKPL